MTISIEIGKFKAKISHDSGFGTRHRVVEFDVMWRSSGTFKVSYYQPRNAKDHHVIVTEDWYPPDTYVSFTPEQFEKVWELFPCAIKQDRQNCHKPFYSDYDLSRGMFDCGDDRLFMAYKDPHEDCEKVYLVNHYFSYGVPTTETCVLGLEFEDFKTLKVLLDSKKDEIFYSGCIISWPSPNLVEDHR